MKELYSLNEIKKALDKCYKFTVDSNFKTLDDKFEEETIKVDAVSSKHFLHELRGVERDYHFDLWGSFTKEFREEFEHDAEFNAIFQSILRGMTPFEAIEHLCKSKKEITTHLNKAIELGGIPPIENKDTN